MNETPWQRKRRLTRERQARWRARQDDETLERIKKQNAERQAQRIANESEEQTAARRARDAFQKRMVYKRVREEVSRSDFQTYNTGDVYTSEMCPETFNLPENGISFITGQVLTDTKSSDDAEPIKMERPTSPQYPHELVDIVFDDNDSQIQSEDAFLGADGFQSMDDDVLHRIYAEQCRANQKTEEYRTKKLKLLEEQIKLQRAAMAYYPQIIQVLKSKLTAPNRSNKLNIDFINVNDAQNTSTTISK